jgi:hypothetical protein
VSNPSIFADVDRLRFASATCGSVSGDFGQIGRGLSSVPMPAMPASTDLEVRGALWQISRSIFDIERELATDSRTLDHTAWLFEESQRLKGSSPSVYQGLWAAVQSLDQLSLLAPLIAASVAGEALGETPGKAASAAGLVMSLLQGKARIAGVAGNGQHMGVTTAIGGAVKVGAQPVPSGQRPTIKELLDRAREGARGKEQPTAGDECLVYAQKRGIGAVAAGSDGNDGAFNLLFEENDHLSGRRKANVSALVGVADLRDVLHPDDFIIWDVNGGANPKYGHVAVVELVEANRVVISETNWDGNLNPSWRVLATQPEVGADPIVPGMYGYPHPKAK